MPPIRFDRIIIAGYDSSMSGERYFYLRGYLPKVADVKAEERDNRIQNLLLKILGSPVSGFQIFSAASPFCDVFSYFLFQLPKRRSIFFSSVFGR